MKDNNQLPPLHEWTNERIDYIAELTVKGMPDGIRGFLVYWGWQQFARALMGNFDETMRAFALQARAQVQGELSVDQMREMLSVHKLAIVPMRATHAMLDAMSDDDWQWSDLLAAAEAITEDEHDWIDATPQPAQATQAEVTDEQINAVALEQWGPHTGGPLAAHRAFARAILTLRPERVPMTDDERGKAYLKQTKSYEGHRSTFMRGVWAAEAHHGITAQAKKEGA